MKTLKIIVSKDGLELGPLEPLSPQELVVKIVKNAILIAAGQAPGRGLGEEDRRKYYKICDVFDTGIKTSAETVQLEDDWFKLIETSFKAKFVPDNLFRRVEDLIAEVK